MTVPEKTKTNLSPVARSAVSALAAFGGDVDRAAARRLLGMWARRNELDDADVRTVLHTFPCRAER